MKMNKEEIKKWFWKKFNSCYPVQDGNYKENYYLYYDNQVIRQMKLCRITGKEIKYPEKPSGDMLFYLDFKNGYFHCDYEKIWLFFESNYSANYYKIITLINEMLKEHDNLSVLTHNLYFLSQSILLKEHDNLSMEKKMKKDQV